MNGAIALDRRGGDQNVTTREEITRLGRCGDSERGAKGI